MRNTKRYLFPSLLGLLWLPIAQAATDCTAVTEIPPVQCEALVALYNSTDGANWSYSQDWNVTNTPCSWWGITCSTGQVTEIDLGYNNLNGPIPTELGNLSQLTTLDLDYNQLTGSIPSELANLSQLTTLNLGGTVEYDDNGEPILSGLSGAIPISLGNLSQLTTLNLSDNQLTGSIPTELGNLSQLTTLDLSGIVQYNDNGEPILSGLSGAIPTSLGNLSQLTELDLGGNQLTGSIPTELGNLSLLTRLDLYGNQLTGTIPTELANLSQLTELRLNGNQLTGTIPTELANLSQLAELSLCCNELTGSIPAELANLSQLTSLQLYGNQLTGTIPTSLGNLSQLENLELDGNQLIGTIPTELGNLSQLTYLWLSYNQLTGPIPAELGNLSQLQDIYLSDNQLTGPIPAELGNLSELWILDLANNQLSGEIPTSLSNLTNLDWLDLNYNNLTASDPDLINFLNNIAPGWADTQTFALTSCATGTVTITPTTLDFGSEAVGNSLALTANIRSQGCENLQIDTVEFTGNHAAEFSAQDKECYDGEWQGQTFTACQFNIVFLPTAADDKEATLNVVFSDTNVPAATMPLQATAVDPGSPNISVSPNTIDFGSVTVGEGQLQKFTVENTGDVNLQFDAITLTGENASEFSFYGNCSSKTFMRPNEQCQLSAQFIPNSEGDKQAALDISSISTVALIGQATPLLDCADGNITIQTVTDGSWDSADSWDVDRIPNGNDVVKINSGHTITGSASYLNVKTLCVETDATLESLDDQGTALQIDATDYLGNKGTIRGQDGVLGQPGASIRLSTGNGWWLGNPFYNEGSIIAGHGGDSQQQGGHGGMIHISGGGIINTPSESGTGGIIQAGNGGDMIGTQSGQAGNGGRITMWGSQFLLHQGDIRMTAGNGGNCNPNASGFQTGGKGGKVGINANLSIHLQGTFQAGKGGINCNANGTDGIVYIDPDVISISGANTTISGGDIIVNGADTIELTDLGNRAIQASGDITLAVSEDNVIDMRGNTGQFLQAGGQVQILADEIVLDKEVTLSQVIQATNTMVGPSRVLRDVSLTASGKLSAEPGETVFINVTLSNNGPETDTYTLSVTDSQGWSLTPLPDSSIEIEGLGGINFVQEVTLSANPGERNLITITATSQADAEVKAIAEVQVTVAGGSPEKPLSASNSSGSGTKPLRPTMNIFVEIHGQGQGRVEIISDKGSMTCEPKHCETVDYAQDFTKMVCDPNYCTRVVDTGTTVTLNPEADNGSFFKSWGGHPDCGKNERPVTGNRLCIAYFGQLED